MKKALRLLVVMLLVVSLVVQFAGCGSGSKTDDAPQPQESEAKADATDDSEAPAEPKELEKVRIGITPYPMYVVFAVADELGIDHDLGIDLDIEVFTGTSTGAQALTRGDIKITSACIAEHLPLISGSPDIVNFAPVGNFKGFFYVGRESEFTPWEELVEKEGSVEAAKETRLNEFKGKTFCIIPQRKALILDTIAQIGLTEDDITLMNFADDAKAANAFLSGTGDIYIGSLPQQRSLVAQDGFVNIGGQEILGTAGLWFDTMLTTDKFMEEERETALRLYSTMLASINAFYDDQDGYSEIAAKIFTDLSGVETPAEEWKTFMTEFDELVSVENAGKEFYNKEDPMYWGNVVDYNIELLVAQGDLEEGVTGEQYFGGGESLYSELMTRDDLLEIINSTTINR